MSLQSKPLSGAARHTLLLGKYTFVFAVLTVIVVACLPQSGWVVRTQLRNNTEAGQRLKGITNPAPLEAERIARVQSIAKSRPHDFALQLASALRQEEGHIPNGSPEDGASHRAAQRVWRLRARFPNEPALYATYLRLNCMQGGTGRVVEQELLTSASLQEAQATIAKRLSNKPAEPGYWESHPEWLATMIEAAQTGERLDPRNAYFPFVLAACYFARKEDTRALSAIDRAAKAARWNGYYTVESDGRLALSEAEYGRTGLIAQVAIVASQLFPDLAHMRATARTATALAILREQQGDGEGGLHIRRSLGRVGALMRRDGGSVISSLVGIAVVQVASARPGGAPPIRKQDGDSDKVAKLRQAAYSDYLMRTGHADEAQWYQEETQRGAIVKDISRRGMNSSIMGGVGLVWVCAWWSACFVLLTSAFWMLIGGGVGALIARGARVRDSAPLHFAARRGLAVTLLAPIVGGLVTLSFSTSTDGKPSWAAPLSAVLLLLGTPIIFLIRNPSGTGREMTRAQHRLDAVRCLKIYGKVVGMTLVVLAVIGVSIPFLLSGVLTALALLPLMSSWGDGQDMTSLHQAGWFLIGVGGTCLLVLLLTFTGSLVWSLKRKVPASVGFALGFRSAALPVTGVMLLLYTGAIVQTARTEAKASNELINMRQHEGRYLASLLHIPWPELVPDAGPAQKAVSR